MKKHLLIIIFLTVITAFLPVFIHAQTSATSSDTTGAAPKQLETNYPAIPQAVPPTTTATALPEYVKYIFMFAIVAAGLLALLMMVIAGVQWSASVGNPGKMQDAKDKIFSALLGLAILVSSWLILNTINPQLTYLREPDEIYILPDIAPGVYVCTQRVDIIGFWQERRTAESQEGNQLKFTAQRLNANKENINKNCYILPGGADIKKEFEDKVQFVYLVPSYKQNQYGVVVYDETGFKGNAQPIYGDTQGGVAQLERPTEWSVSTIKVSSARPFILNFNPPGTWYAKFYELIQYNRDDINNKASSTECKPGTGTSGATSTCQLPHITSSSGGGSGLGGLLGGLGGGLGGGGGKPKIGSSKIEGNMFVVFRKNSGDWLVGDEIYILTPAGDANLYDNVIGKWDTSCTEKTPEFPEGRLYPCAQTAVLVSADFY